EARQPPFCKTDVSTSPFFSVVVFLCHFVSVLVRWLGGSFGFFSVGLCVEKNTNVPPNALAYVSLNNCPSVNNFVMSVGLMLVKSDLNLTSETLSGILILSTFEMS